VQAPGEFEGATQEVLLQPGIFTKSGRGRARLASEVEALVLPAVLPELTILLSISDTAEASGEPRLLCFNWMSGSVVVNWVDGQGHHPFAAYARDELQACLADADRSRGR